MLFFEILRQMLRSLWAHKLRSFLTMFGIAWGVGSLLLLVGLGEGFRSGNRRELNSIGEDIMFIFPGRAPAVAGNMSSGHEYRLTYRDYLDVKNEAPHVQAGSSRAAANRHSRGQRVRQLQRRSGGGAPDLQPDPLSAVGRRPLDQRRRRGAKAQRRRDRRRDAEEPVSRAGAGQRRQPDNSAERCALRYRWRDRAHRAWRQQLHQQSSVHALLDHAPVLSR